MPKRKIGKFVHKTQWCGHAVFGIIRVRGCSDNSRTGVYSPLKQSITIEFKNAQREYMNVTLNYLAATPKTKLTKQLRTSH